MFCTVKGNLTYKKEVNGFVILTGVIVIGAIAIVVAVSLILIGLGLSRTSFANEQSAQAKGLADACAEYALNQLRNDSNYAGDEILSIGPGSCYIRPVLGSGNTNRTVETIGTVGPITRKVKIQVLRIKPKIEITAWQEVADF